MPDSQNGYPVLDDDTTGPQPRLRLFEVPGVNRQLLVRDGSTGFLLVHLTMWFDDRIESVDAGGLDDWGYSRRQIGGSNEWSNHASGTAIDLNALRHPQGVPTHETFSAIEINRVHNRLDFYNQCIGWGGDYRSTPDGMHFEIIRQIGVVERRARVLSRSGRGARILTANPGLKQVIFS